jgi:hypothetical protein
MDGIVVKLGIHDVISGVSHLLVTEDTFIGNLLEGTGDGVLNIGEILDTLGGVANDVGSATVWSVVPDLGGNVLIKVVVINQVLDSLFLIKGSLGSNFVVNNVLARCFGKWLGGSPESVLFIWGLRKAGHAADRGDSLVVTDDWIINNNFDTFGVELSEIFQTDLDVEITATGDNVLTSSLVLRDDDEWIRLGEFCETLNKLWKVRWVSGRD